LIDFSMKKLFKRPTACVSRLGWERGFAVETEKAQSHEKRLKNAARTPSRLHALLAGVLNCCTL
jgi:hypothetical protein